MDLHRYDEPSGLDGRMTNFQSRGLLSEAEVALLRAQVVRALERARADALAESQTETQEREGD